MRSFITATMIAQRLCSPSRDGQELLPQLVAKLITASVPKEAVHAFRFPHGDQVYLPGEDGILAVDDAFKHLYVRAGISVWEMGTSMDPKSKADDDFAKAELKLANAFPNVAPSVTPDKATFVFVTAKPWESGEWVRQKRATSTWGFIKVLDAVDLEKWIEQWPAVMLWFANECGLPAEGLYDTEQYLRKLGIGFGISALSPDLVIAGRDEDLRRLTTLVVESNAEIHLHAESIEEAAAFLASASLKQADEYAKKPPLVFADSRANLNLLATCDAELTLVPLDSETLARFKTVQRHTWRAIVPEVKSTATPNSTSQRLTLGQCKRAVIEQHLTIQMTFPERKAGQISRESKGSLIALLWLVGSGPVGTPRWATRKDATTHASLMLAGSWVGDNENDTKIIERLSRQEYRDIETLLQSAEVPEGPWIHWGTEWTCASKDFVWGQLIAKITETMLHDFHKIVCEVIGEKDPSLELKSSERHMAAILGKTRKHSNSLRGGLMDSVARLSVMKSDGQGWANRIVRDLLDPENPDAADRWLSVVDVYSEIAEAAPDMFLDCLDAMLRTGGAKQFFQDAANDGTMFRTTSAHMYLLWALERLAWQKQYFSRVLSVLGRLAEMDPGVKTGNTPMNSLITILLPWKPQHTETMQTAVQAIGMLYSVCPTVAWDVAIALLPTSHSHTSPTPTPDYREFAGEREVTWQEYWEFTRTIVELMIAWAGSDVTRWACFIKKYPELRRDYPEAGELISNALFQVDTGRLTDEQKAVVHDALRDLVLLHRQHPDTEWALPIADIETLESLQKRFTPEDMVLQHVHLFSWDPDVADAPMRQYEDGWDEWLAGRQAEAAKAVYGQQGLTGIHRLAEKSHVPDCVGRAAATLQFQETEVTELMRRGLSAAPSDHANNPLTRTVRAYVWAKYREKGEVWLDSILTGHSIIWTPEAYANLALGLPPSPALWQRIQQWGEQADRLYWMNIEIHGRPREHWAEVLEKWKAVGRPWSALELVAAVVDDRRSAQITTKPSVEQVIDVLEQALRAGDSVEPHRRGTMLNHWVEGLFSFLDTQDLAPERLAHLEWSWFQVLKNTKRGTRTLQSQVTSSPKLFVELLRLVFRADGEPKNEEVSEDQRRLAGHAYDVLQGIKTVPGYKSGSAGGEVDPSTLRDWVMRARTIAEEVGRLGVCDGRIGQVLSYAPPSPDGSWPCVEARDLIEELQSTRLERSIVIGKCNQRGVVRRGEGGGKQEWDLAKKYRALADMVRDRWPRSASILDNLTEHYEFDARQWDERAKRDEYRR